MKNGSKLCPDRRDVMLQKVVSGLDSCKIILSPRLCLVCVLLVRTRRYVRRLFWSSEGGTRIAMPKTDLRPDTLSLKPGSQATKGVLD